MKYIEHTVIEHLCEDCAMPLADHEGGAHYADGELYLCLDCALRRKLLDAEEWLSLHGMSIYDHAMYKDEKIILYRKWGKGYQKTIIDPFARTEG